LSPDDLSPDDPCDVVCLSLEPWDEVWRRNQHMATQLLRLRPSLRLLFVGNPVDIAWSLREGRFPELSPLRSIGDTGRLWTMTPHKWLPRSVWPRGDHSLFRQVAAAGHRLGFVRPVLWINDSTYAPLIGRTGWPSVYDVTDDWLLAQGAPREMDRQRRNDAHLLRDASEVVVCSPALARSRGGDRPVHLIANGVDVESLRAPTERPADLPIGRIALYLGTLSAGRLDIDLCLTLARALAGRATLVFVGPSSLPADVDQALADVGAVILGQRPYTEMPAYLQAADVQVVPHQTTPFIESLDPLKAREFLAVGRPAVATPVAGFRDLDPPIAVADRSSFVDAVLAVLDRPPMPPGPGPVRGVLETWSVQAARFLAVIDTAAGRPTG
jgi:teichuronic acid biosynthesis glycosyltransferase TuaH